MTIEEYIQSKPPERQEALRQLRKMMKSAFPSIEETMGYRMPTYVLDGEILCAFASQKSYLAFYVMPYDLLDAFQDELEQYNCGKSCIRMKKMTQQDLALLKKIDKHCGKHYVDSKFYGKISAK